MLSSFEASLIPRAPYELVGLPERESTGGDEDAGPEGIHRGERGDGALGTRGGGKSARGAQWEGPLTRRLFRCPLPPGAPVCFVVVDGGGADKDDVPDGDR